AVHVELPAHKRVRAAHLPDNRAGLVGRRHKLASLHLDVFCSFRALAPGLPGEVRTILPTAIADAVQCLTAPDFAVRRARPPDLEVGATVVPDWDPMTPAPH